MVSVNLHCILIKINDLSFKLQFSVQSFYMFAHFFLLRYVLISSPCSGEKRKPSSLDKG